MYINIYRCEGAVVGHMTSSCTEVVQSDTCIVQASSRPSPRRTCSLQHRHEQVSHPLRAVTARASPRVAQG